MSWKGESRRHSLARRGIQTADGVSDYLKEAEAKRREQWKARKIKEIENRKNYLKRFLPGWFVDSLEYRYIMDIDEDEYIKPKDKTRIKRLEESIGEDVIFVSSIPPNQGVLFRKVKLIAVDGDEVVIEADGKEFRTKAFNIRYVKRKQPRNPRRKREIPIPQSHLPFKLVTDVYDWEEYQAPANWNGIPVTFRVFLQHHSYLGGWSVHYSIMGKKYSIRMPESGRADTRKEARKIAHDLISHASITDIDRLSDSEREALLKD